MRVFLVAVMIVCASSRAAADATTTEAKQLFERGVQELALQHWQAAEALLRRSVELAPRSSSLYNLALALCELERYRECAEVSARVAADPSSSYREHAGLLSERAQGRLAQEANLETEASQPPNVQLRVPNSQPIAAAPPPPPLRPSRVEDGPNVAAWVATGAGALLLSAALVTGLMAADADDDFVARCGGTRDCDPGLKPVQQRARNLALASDVLLALGVVSTGTGATLWLLDTHSDRRRAFGLRWSARY